MTDWLAPDPYARPFPFPPRRVFGLRYDAVFWATAYVNTVQLVRFYLAHPDRRVPGYPGPVVGVPHGGSRNGSKRAREERSELVRRLNREHLRRVITTFWPLLDTLAQLLSEIGQQDAARG